MKEQVTVEFVGGPCDGRQMFVDHDCVMVIVPTRVNANVFGHQLDMFCHKYRRNSPRTVMYNGWEAQWQNSWG